MINDHKAGLYAVATYTYTGYPVGLPKNFWVSIPNGHSLDWPKSRMYTKFRVPRSAFYHVPRGPKTPSQAHIMR